VDRRRAQQHRLKDDHRFTHEKPFARCELALTDVTKWGQPRVGWIFDMERIGHATILADLVMSRATDLRYTRPMASDRPNELDQNDEQRRRASGGEPSPIEDVRRGDSIIEVNEPSPEDERVDELLNAITVDLPELADAVEQQEAPDAADTLEQIGEAAVELIEEMETESAAEALAHMHPSLAVGVLEDLIEEDPSYAGKLIEEMAPDDATDLLQNLTDESRDRLLGTLGKVEAVKFRRLLEYPERSAGGMMTTDYLAVRDSMSVREAIEAIRRAESLGEDWLYVFVVDWRGRLQGRATMRALLLADPAQRVIAISEKRVDAVKPNIDREDVAREFEKYDYLVLPVVDDEDRMLGVITVDDVVDAIRQEGTEDAQAMFGAGRQEAVFSSVADKLRGRLPWLFVNLFTSSIAAIVVLQFDGLITSIAFLAVIMPVIANQAGNAGQQSLAVTLRGIVLDEVREGSALRLVRREAIVGMVNGTICGLLVGGVVAGIEYLQHPEATMWKLGAVVAISMTIALSVGTVVGSSLPLLVRRFGADPATASTIFLTMVTDSMSFLVFLGLASALSGWIGIGVG
jgi:magnesium transporter